MRGRRGLGDKDTTPGAGVAIGPTVPIREKKDPFGANFAVKVGANFAKKSGAILVPKSCPITLLIGRDVPIGHRHKKELNGKF